MDELYLKLEKGKIEDIYDVCNKLNEYAKGLPQDNNSIANFYDFCIDLFDRLFGENVTDRETQMASAWATIKFGGWLRLAISKLESWAEFTDVRVVLQSKVKINAAVQALVAAVVIRSETMNVLRIGRENFKINASSFPKRAQMVHESPDTSYITLFDSSYHQRLDAWFQKAVKLSDAAHNYLSLPPFEYFLLCLVRYPAHDQIYFERIQMKRQVLNPPTPAASIVPETSLLPTNPYTLILFQYVRDLLPHDVQTRSAMDMDVAYLFLILISEFWISSALVVRRDHQAFLRFKTKLVSSSTDRKICVEPGDVHPDPCTVILVDDSVPKYTENSLKCLHFVLSHILSDKDLLLKMNNQCTANLRWLSSEQSYYWNPTSASASASASSTGAAAVQVLATSGAQAPVDQACLPALLQPIQAPLFEMLRTIFTWSDRHPATFFQAVDIWLLYIQPWNMGKGEGIEVGGPCHFTLEWKVYVAANFHFYTTVFVIFIKQLSAIRFETDPDKAANFQALFRVLNVFSGDLLTTICQLHQQFTPWYTTRSRRVSCLTPTKETDLFSRRSPDKDRLRQPKISMSPESVLMNAMMTQHHLMFPDARVDSLEGLGITNVKWGGTARFVMIFESLIALQQQADLLWMTGWIELWTKFTSLLDPGSASAASSSNEVRITEQRLLTCIERLRDIDPQIPSNPQVDHLTKAVSKLEWELLATPLIDVSVLLNEMLQLPRTRNSEFLSWSEVFQTASMQTSVSAVEFILGSYRFNLRVLSQKVLLMAVMMALFFKFGFRASYFALCALVTLHGVKVLKGIFGSKEDSLQSKADLLDTGGAMDPFVVACGDKGFRPRKELLRYRGDALDAPYYNGEIEGLARLLIRTSKYLNSRFDLPLDKSSSVWSTGHVMSRAIKNFRTRNPVYSLLEAFRFNLRVLASVRAIAVVSLMITFSLYRLQALSALYFILSVVPVTYCIIQG